MMSDLHKTYPWLYKFCRCAFCPSDRSVWGWTLDRFVDRTDNDESGQEQGRTHPWKRDDSVRLMWVQSMHKYATVHAAVCNLTNLEHSTHDTQHVESGKSRTIWDLNDTRVEMVLE